MRPFMVMYPRTPSFNRRAQARAYPTDSSNQNTSVRQTPQNPLQ